MKPLIAIVFLSLACASAPPPSPAPVAQKAPAREEDDGVEGGVEGGTCPGGCAPDMAKLLSPRAGSAQRMADLNDPRYKPAVRAEFNRPGALYWGLFKTCVSTSGQVTSVTALRSTRVPAIDADWQATIKSWPHRPYEQDGKAVPFCYPLRVEVRTEEKDDGVEGGVEGGVAGGTSNIAKLLPPNVGAGQLLTDPHDPKYSPKVRPEYVRPGSAYWGLLKICVTAAGHVNSVSFLRSTGIGELDADWTKTVETWSYRSYTINGKPVPFCHPMRLEVRMPKKRS